MLEQDWEDEGVAGRELPVEDRAAIVVQQDHIPTLQMK